MRKETFLRRLGSRTAIPEELTNYAEKDPDLIPEILKGVSSPKTRVKFCCSKIASIMSERRPEILYPEFEFFVGLLDSDNNIIRWNAIDTLANLAGVDDLDKFNRIFERYYGLLEDESMITAGHVVDNSGKIAKAKPHLVAEIASKLLKVEAIPRNPECRNILLGKVIMSFDEYSDCIGNGRGVMAFVERQTMNTRNATKMKAERFLKRRA